MRLVSFVLVSVLAVPAGAELIAGRFTAGAHQPGAKRRMERRHDAEQQRLHVRQAREMAICRQSAESCSSLAAAHKREVKQLEQQHEADHRSFAAATRDLSGNSD